jgi:hypothetical protein
MKQVLFIISLCFALLLTGETKAQTASSDNKISESITFHDMPKGKNVYGIFEGRSPCAQISKLLRATLPPDLDHLKWQVIFYRDSVTGKPTTFSLTTEMFDRKPLTGKWNIIHGTKNNPASVLIVLNSENPSKRINLLKGDENVLFILDENLDFMPGNDDFSYTLNRVNKVRQLSGN